MNLRKVKAEAVVEWHSSFHGFHGVQLCWRYTANDVSLPSVPVAKGLVYNETNSIARDHNIKVRQSESERVRRSQLKGSRLSLPPPFQRFFHSRLAS